MKTVPQIIAESFASNSKTTKWLYNHSDSKYSVLFFHADKWLYNHSDSKYSVLFFHADDTASSLYLSDETFDRAMVPLDQEFSVLNESPEEENPYTVLVRQIAQGASDFDSCVSRLLAVNLAMNPRFMVQFICQCLELQLMHGHRCTDFKELVQDLRKCQKVAWKKYAPSQKVYRHFSAMFKARTVEESSEVFLKVNPAQCGILATLIHATGSFNRLAESFRALSECQELDSPVSDKLH